MTKQLLVTSIYEIPYSADAVQINRASAFFTETDFKNS